MKVSKYNRILKVDNKDIVFNSLSCALAEIDESFYTIIDNIRNINYDKLDDKNKELVDNMLEGNFIVHDDVDEYKNIKYRNLSAKFSNGVLSLTIAPTLDCNFACPYCYENAKKGFMDIETQNAIVSMVKDSLDHIKVLDISWYGGEPLLAKDIIINMSNKMIKLSEEHNIEYKASMITNGYLLNEKLIQELIKLKVYNYQITIDGPPEIHNERRRARGEKIDTFNKILHNVKLLNKMKANPSIRVNVDNSNVKYINDLLDILEENNLKDLNVNFGHVRMDSKVCESIIGCMQNEEFAKFDFKYNKILEERGFNSKTGLYYPKLKSNYCCADSTSSYVIDPDGYMYKCWNEVGEPKYSIGNVRDTKNISDKMYNNNVNYILWSPFEIEKCKECFLLPICMGGCPYNGLKHNGEPECEKWKYIIDDILVNMYNKYNKKAELLNEEIK